MTPGNAESRVGEVTTDGAEPGIRKGLIFGECGTDGCTNKARWIPTSDIPVAPQPFVYRCPECCDRIDAERRGQ